MVLLKISIIKNFASAVNIENMEKSTRSKKAKTQPMQLTSSLIASALDSENAHTSFGKLPLSKE